jgi:hypothetical protein
MNRETEKQFQTDYERRRRETSDYMNEELKLGVKYELPTGETGYIMTGGSKDPKDWKFSGKSYLSVKDKLKPTKEQPGKYDGAYDMGMGKGHHIDESKYFSLEKGDKLKVSHPIYKNLTLTITNPKGSGYEYYSKHDEGGVEKGWAEAGYFSSAIEKGDAELIKAVDEGTCGYGEDGKIGKIPAGAHLQKEDMNDPVLVKARAAKMADEKEKAKQAALNKKYGSSFMDKLDAEIGLKQELQDLKDEREQLMIDMEQEAEPEGGEIADRYGSRLNDIDAKMAEIKSELDDLRMYESVNKDEIDEELFTPNEMGDEAVEKESDSAAYESLQESLRKKLRERLK